LVERLNSMPNGDLAWVEDKKDGRMEKMISFLLAIVIIII